MRPLTSCVPFRPYTTITRLMACYHCVFVFTRSVSRNRYLQLLHIYSITHCTSYDVLCVPT
uniref:Uncharacterized protein n=1 Tax=Virus sp. cts3e7 TaxID=2825802 RepID=A0A8S5RN93_9VIRU|nr:MAG TPA: hypothetical protein [Virus sp. cts3e7]